MTEGRTKPLRGSTRRRAVSCASGRQRRAVVLRGLTRYRLGCRILPWPRIEASAHLAGRQPMAPRCSGAGQSVSTYSAHERRGARLFSALRHRRTSPGGDGCRRNLVAQTAMRDYEDVAVTAALSVRPSPTIVAKKALLMQNGYRPRLRLSSLYPQCGQAPGQSHDEAKEYRVSRL